MQYIILIPDEYTRDTQIINDTHKMTDEELTEALFDSAQKEKYENKWCDFNGSIFIGTIHAKNENEAVNKFAELNHYDKRILTALPLTNPESWANATNDVQKALDIYKAPKPNGGFRDGDTILADYIENADMQQNGLCEELLGIWLNTDDKQAVENLFELLTDVTFHDYIRDCIQNTTPKENTDNKQAVENLFERLTNVTVPDYIRDCIQNTTPKENT